MDSIVDLQTELICQYDKGLRLTYVNRAYSEWLGLPKDALLGTEFMVRIPAEEQEEAQSHIKSLTPEHPVAVSTHHSLLSDGTSVIIEWTDRALFDDNGHLTGYLGVGRDVTARKKTEDALRRSENRYRQIFDINDLPKLLIDPATGGIVNANQTACDYCGYERAILKTLSIENFISDPVAEIGTKPAPNQPRSFRRGDGTFREVEIFSGPIEYEGRQLLYTTLTDITEREQAKSALKEANWLLEKRVAERTAELEKVNNRLEAIFNHSGDAILLLDIEQGIQQANHTFETLFAVQPSGYLGKNLPGFFQPEDAAEISPAIHSVAATNQKQQIESRLISGTEVEISLAPVNRLFQPVNSLVCIIRDITERKHAEEALRDNEARYRLLAENVTDIIIRTRAGGTINFVTTSSLAVLGYKPEELVGRTTSSIIHPEDWEAGRQIFEKALANHAPSYRLLQRFYHKNGYWVTVEVNNTLVYNPASNKFQETISVVRDITERTKAEEALRESESRYRFLAENITDVIIRTKPGGTMYSVTTSCYNLLGYYPDELVGQNTLSLIHPDDQEYSLGLFANAREAGETSYRFTLRLRHKDGHYLPVEIINTLIYDPATGNFLETNSVMRDFTERQKAEEALRESEARYRLLAENVTDVIVKYTPDGVCTYVTPSVFASLGYTPEEIVGKPMAGYLHPDDVEAVYQISAEAVNSGAASYTISHRTLHKDGHYGWYESTNTIIRDPATGSNQGGIAVFRDINERKKAEENLQLALEKEKELSELKTRFVTMASHEFRTPLASILATAETLTRYRERMDQAQIDTRLDKIRHQVLHLTEIINDVLSLARLQAGKMAFNPSPGELGRLCRETIEEYESLPGNHGRLIMECPDSPVNAYYDSHLLQQVFGNLVSNALLYSPAEKTVNISLAQDETRVVFQVRDHGIGIPPEDLGHLFEPFYRASNVETIRGTGLGLNITKQAVELHSGVISVESTPEAGSTFTVIIPKTLPGS